MKTDHSPGPFRYTEFVVVYIACQFIYSLLKVGGGGSANTMLKLIVETVLEPFAAC